MKQCRQYHEQINTAISATKQAMDNARAAMKSALETGDVDKQMKAQELLMKDQFN